MAVLARWSWGTIADTLRGGVTELVAICNRRMKALEVFLRNPTTDTLNVRGAETGNKGLLWVAGAILDSTAALFKSGFYLTTRVSGAYGGGFYIFPTLVYKTNGDYMFGGYIGAEAIETSGKTGINYESLGVGGGPNTITGGGSFALSNGLFIAHPTTAMAAATIAERVGLDIQSQYYGALTPASPTAVYSIRVASGGGRAKFGDNISVRDIDYIWPAAGAAGQLTNDGANNLSWTAGGAGAPVGASYLTLGLDGTLTSERVLTEGTNLTFTDTGAGGTLTVALDVTEDVQFNQFEGLQFVVENRTSDPGAPVTGQLWIRTDL